MINLDPLLTAIADQLKEMQTLESVCDEIQDRYRYRNFQPTITPIRGGFEVITKGATCFRKLEVTQAKGIKSWIGDNPHDFLSDKQDILPTFAGIEDGLFLVLRQPIDFQQKLRILSHVWETLIVNANQRDHLLWFEWTLGMGENIASCDNGHLIAFSKRIKSLIRSRQELGAIAADTALFMLDKLEQWTDSLKVKSPLFLTDALVQYQGSEYAVIFIGFDEEAKQYYYWIKNRSGKVRVLESEIEKTDSCSQVSNSAPNSPPHQLTLF